MSHAQSAHRNGITNPADRPNADTVIYDGKCGFCQHQMGKLDRWDKDGQLAYVSLHDPQVAERWPELSKDDLMREICLVSKAGQRFHCADAFKYIARQLTIAVAGLAGDADSVEYAGLAISLSTIRSAALLVITALRV